MTPRRPIPRPQPGRPVREWAASVAETLARLRIIPGLGVATEETPAGTILHAQASFPLVEALTGASGIAAATSSTQYSSGTVTVYACDDGGALTSTGRTITAWNKDTANAVGNNKQVLIQQNQAGLWLVVWEQC